MVGTTTLELLQRSRNNVIERCRHSQDRPRFDSNTFNTMGYEESFDHIVSSFLFCSFRSLTDALPGLQRCVSTEDSTGWVEHEEFLRQRHSTRHKRCAELVLPKLTSSFADFHGEEDDSGPAAHTVGGVPDIQILGSTTSAQDDFCSSARHNRFFEALNDTTGRPKRMFRKTPPPPTIRGGSTSDVLTHFGEETGENWVL